MIEFLILNMAHTQVHVRTARTHAPSHYLRTGIIAVNTAVVEQH
jgi:hypothetical protein